MLRRPILYSTKWLGRLRIQTSVSVQPLKRPRPKGQEPEREPVEPPRPNLLSGGAAAELEFDE